jgi:hypothetical protein
VFLSYALLQEGADLAAAEPTLLAVLELPATPRRGTTWRSCRGSGRGATVPGAWCEGVTSKILVRAPDNLDLDAHPTAGRYAYCAFDRGAPKWALQDLDL